MQVSKITLTNFKGGKLPQAVKKAAKPVTEEIKPDFSVYAYGVPTGDMPKAINTAKEALFELFTADEQTEKLDESEE